MQEFAPIDDELAAYRKGEEWNKEKAEELAKQRVRRYIMFIPIPLESLKVSLFMT